MLSVLRRCTRPAWGRGTHMAAAEAQQARRKRHGLPWASLEHGDGRPLLCAPSLPHLGMLCSVAGDGSPGGVVQQGTRAARLRATRVGADTLACKQNGRWRELGCRVAARNQNAMQRLHAARQRGAPRTIEPRSAGVDRVAAPTWRCRRRVAEGRAAVGLPMCAWAPRCSRTPRAPPARSYPRRAAPHRGRSVPRAWQHR